MPGFNDDKFSGFLSNGYAFFNKECPEWLTDYDHGDDNYDSITKEDCRTSDKVSKSVMDSPSECQLACISDQNCAGFTYLEEGGLCGLYNSSGVERGGKKSGHISGMRDNCVTDHSRCICNGYIGESGGGECKTTFKGSLWCYVNKNSTCIDKRLSTSGQSFQWSEEACKPVQINQNGEVSCSSDADCPCDKFGQNCYVCAGEGEEKTCKVSLALCKTVVSCRVNEEEDRGVSFYEQRCVSFGSTLSETSIISGMSVLSLDSPIQNCPPRSCRRNNKCCRLAVMTNAGRLGCPYRC